VISAVTADCQIVKRAKNPKVSAIRATFSKVPNKVASEIMITQGLRRRNRWLAIDTPKTVTKAAHLHWI
jgi:hypothetical protein